MVNVSYDNGSASDTVQLTVFADYHHFTLEDEGLGTWNVPADWGEQLTARKIAAVPGEGRVLGIGTVRAMDVPVEITVASAPPENLAGWDHVTEGGVAVPTGSLIVMGPGESHKRAPRVPLSPGTYRARVFYGGFDSLSDDGLDGDDHYRVVLWPGELGEPTVLKPYAAAYFPGG